MTLRKCSKCGIDFHGVICPGCGTRTIEETRPRKPSMPIGPWVKLIGLLLGGGLFVFLVLNSCVNDLSTVTTSTAPSQAPKLTLRPDQHELLTKLETQGLLRLDRELRRAWVDPALWAGMNAQLKADFAAVLATECANHQRSEWYSVEIFDNQSAKKIAEHTYLGGFKAF